MKILMIHNSYQQYGGEDAVFDQESELLRAFGHDVVEYKRRNDEINHYGAFRKATLSLRTIWASDSVAAIRKLIDNGRPDVAHFHNTFPLISPAAYYACREAGIPVVQSLHNPRLICPAATFHREGRACTDCLGKLPAWPGLLHACYQNSRIKTGVIAGMVAFHSYLGTWDKLVDTYVVFSDFYRVVFASAGFPREKLSIKPHFIAPDPGRTNSPQSYALFVGRLAREKGVETLLEAWKALKHVPLKVRGEGYLAPQVLQLDPSFSVELVPRLSRADLVALFHGARFLVWPSEGYYETFGLVAAEAFASGIPVIASQSGVMAEIVQDGRTGLHFRPGDAGDLAEKVEWAWTHPGEMAVMGDAGRAEYLAKYTAERNYDMLMRIYNRIAAPKPSVATAIVNEAVANSGTEPLLASKSDRIANIKVRG